MLAALLLLLSAPVAAFAPLHAHGGTAVALTSWHTSATTHNRLPVALLSSNVDDAPTAASRREILRGLSAFSAAAGKLGPEQCRAATVVAEATGSQVFSGNINKSPADKRQYRSLTLANGLEVLIVTDPEAEVAAAALDVHAGHYSDPTGLPGLAHFCEHMIFLGNAAFPEEGSFSTFLSANGGSSNAFTDNEDTCFFFDVSLPAPNAEAAFLAADGGLNRFASFFVSPSFTPSGAAREINAVDSEHRKNLKQDVWRLGQLEKAVRANPDHPAFKFGTGSKETLITGASSAAVGDELRAALLAFWRRYYVAPQMTLSVVSRLPVEKVQAAVERYFAAVPRIPRSGDDTPLPLVRDAYSERPEAEWMARGVAAYPVGPRNFAVLAKPVAPIRSLKIEWKLARSNSYAEPSPSPPGSDSPAVANARDVLGKPALIVSNLVGHEGSGSLLQYLKRAGLANSLSSGAAYESTDVQALEVNVDLTPKGLERWEDVAALIFGYFELLRGSGIPDYFIDESVSLAALSWRFSERSEPQRYASSLAENMQSLRLQNIGVTSASAGQAVLGPARYLDGNRLFLQLSPGPGDVQVLATASSLGPLAKELLRKLTPRAASIMVVAPEFEDGGGGIDGGAGAIRRKFPKLSGRERWYETSFLEVPTDSLMRRCDEPLIPPEVFLPPPNAFIPTKFGLKTRLVGTSHTSKKFGKEPTAVKEERQRPPDLVRETERWRYYFKQDKTFGQPRGFLTVLLASATTRVDVDTLISTKLWRLALVDRLAGDVYDALLCGFGFDVDITARGLRMTFFGYDDKLAEFVSLVTGRIKNFDLDNPYGGDSLVNGLETPEQLFDRQKELLRREVQAFDKQQPYQFCKYFEASITEQPHFSRESLQAALERATLAQVAVRAKANFDGGFGKALLQGNLNMEDANGIFATLERTFSEQSGVHDSGSDGIARWARLPAKTYALVPTVAEIVQAGYVSTSAVSSSPTSTSYLFYPTISRSGFDPSNVNSAVEFVWQFPETQQAFFEGWPSKSTSYVSPFSAFPDLPSTPSRYAATAEVYAALLEEPIFDTLRTQQQLGYIVFSGLRNVDGVRSFVIIVQSSAYPAQVLHDRVADFVDGLLTEDESGVGGILGGLSDAYVAKVAAGLIEKKISTEKRLVQQVGRHWEEIISGTFEWDRATSEAAALQKVDLKAILDFQRAAVSPTSPFRRVVAYHVNGKSGSSKVPASPSIAFIRRDLQELQRDLQPLPLQDQDRRRQEEG